MRFPDYYLADKVFKRGKASRRQARAPGRPRGGPETANGLRRGRVALVDGLGGDATRDLDASVAEASEGRQTAAASDGRTNERPVWLWRRSKNYVQIWKFKSVGSLADR